MRLPNNAILIFIVIVIFQSLEVDLSAQERDSILLLASNPDSVMTRPDLMVREVLLNSSPQDAYVFYNDSLIGNTPLFVQSSFSNLILRKSGYDDTVILFDNIKQDNIVSMNYNGQEKEKSFFEKDIFKFLTAGIVVLGGTTAYFKLKADNKFGEYELSGNSKLLDDTKKYDLISGITFTALQINFGLLLYYFLTE